MTKRTENSANAHGWRHLDHTSDCLIRVRSETVKKLFCDAAAALTAQIVQTGHIQKKQSRVLYIQGESLQDCLHTWLSEILCMFELEHFLGSEFLIGNDPFCDSTSERYTVSGTARGEMWDEKRHGICKEVKAVTRHNFYLAKTASFWEAEFLLDL